MADSFVTSIDYHNKTPAFGDEIKFALPAVMTPQHHLLFTLHHISYKHQREDEIVGYAFLPLFKNVFASDGEHPLPIATQLADGYLSGSTDLKVSSWWLECKFQCR